MEHAYFCTLVVGPQIRQGDLLEQVIPNKISCCRSEKPQDTFRQSSDTGVNIGWRFAYPIYYDIKKLIGHGMKLAFEQSSLPAENLEVTDLLIGKGWR